MSTEFYKKAKRKKAEEFKSSSKNSLGGHTEEPAEGGRRNFPFNT